MSRFSFLTIIFLVIACPAMGQEYVLRGFAQRPHCRSGSVNLISESVLLELTSAACRVEAKYVLRNDTNYTDYLRSGLPATDSKQYQNFSLEVDGLAYPVHYKREEEQVIKDKGEYEYSQLIPVHWSLWEMEIAPGQQRTLTLRYIIPIQEQLKQTNNNYRQTILDEFHKMNWQITDEVSVVLSNLDSKIVGYGVLGKSHWTGKNPQSTITIRFFSDTLPGLNSAQKVSEDQFSWKGSLNDSGYALGIKYTAGKTYSNVLASVKKALRRYPQSRSLAAIAKEYDKTPTLKPEPIPAWSQGIAEHESK